MKGSHNKTRVEVSSRSFCTGFRRVRGDGSRFFFFYFSSPIPSLLHRRHAMGHSARSKFKREIRVQRLATVTGTEKDKLKGDAVQLALERAAAAPKIPVTNSRAQDEEVEDAVKDAQLDEDTANAVREAQQDSVNAARWGITAPAMLKTKRGKVTKNEKPRQGGKAKLTAAASFSNDSSKRKHQKKLVKALSSAGGRGR